jgi:hypothetical protein
MNLVRGVGLGWSVEREREREKVVWLCARVCCMRVSRIPVGSCRRIIIFLLDVEGNELADTLATQVTLSSPTYN